MDPSGTRCPGAIRLLAHPGGPVLQPKAMHAIARWSAPVLLTWVAVVARAQPAAAPATEGRRPLDEAVTVTQADPCLTQEAVVGRLGRWLDTTTVAAGIEVVLDPAERAFRVRRPGGRMARRGFAVLPEECSDRLDAVTLAIALAIDHTLLERLRDRAPHGGTQQLDGGAPDGASDAPEPLESPDGAPREDGGAAPGPAPAEGIPLEEAHTPEDEIGPAEPEPEVRSPPDDGRADREARPGPDAAPAAERRWQPGVGAGLLALYDVIPGWALGVQAGPRLRAWRGLELRASLFWTAEQSAPVSTGRAAYDLLGGRLHVCAGGSAGPLTVRGCGGVWAGRLRVRGRGFDEDLSARQLWIALPVGGEVTHRPTRWLELAAGADLVVPVRRPAVQVISDTGTVLERRELPPVGLALGLRAALRLP